MEYDFEVEEIARAIVKQKAKSVVLQLPDGLKPKATKIADKIKEKTDVDPKIYAGSNFGACDTARVQDTDLVVHLGHAKFKK